MAGKNDPFTLEIPLYNIDNPTQNIIHSIQQSRKEILDATIQEIHAQILERNQLTQRVIANIEKEILEKENHIINLKPKDPTRFVEDLDMKRVFELEQTIAQLNKHARSLTVENWQDIAELRKELRELTIELSTLERKQGILEGLLHDATYPSEDDLGAPQKASSHSWTRD